MFETLSNQYVRKNLSWLTVLLGLFGMAPLVSVHALTMHTTDDVFVDLKHTTSNFGAKPNLNVGNVGNGKRGRINQTYLKSSLATLPGLINGTDVDRATLRIWVDEVETPGFVDLLLVNSPWDENLLTGATIPATGFITTLNIQAEDEGHYHYGRNYQRVSRLG